MGGVQFVSIYGRLSVVALDALLVQAQTKLKTGHYIFHCEKLTVVTPDGPLAVEASFAEQEGAKSLAALTMFGRLTAKYN